MPDVNQLVAEALSVAARQIASGQKAPAGTPVVPPWLGQQGLFSYRADDIVLNASLGDVGIAQWLNWYPSIYRNREQALISQMSKEYPETKQTTPCTTCPSYEFKGCEITFCFGRICTETPEFLADDMGVRPSSQYPMRRIYGSEPNIGTLPAQITRDDEWAFVMAGLALRGRLNQMIWPGTPANDSAGGGYREFKGLDMLINTGYRDVETGALCAAADSDVKAFNNQFVCDTGSTNAYTIYQYMVQLYRVIQLRAWMSFGSPINPADMVWVSAPEVIDGIIDCLACTYYPCLAGVGSTALALSADGAANFRDRMVAQQVFHIDGVDIPWVKDPFVTKTTGLAFGDATCADLFLMTRRHGPMELVFGEFQDMAKLPDEKMFGLATPQSTLFSTDGGRFLWTTERIKWCYTASVLLKPRVIVLAPWLQGRITDVCVRTPQHYPDPDPSSTYFVDGGHGTPLGKSLYDYCGDADLLHV